MASFKDRNLNYMTFQALKMKFLNFMTFQVFHDLYQPCNILTECILKQGGKVVSSCVMSPKLRA